MSLRAQGIVKRFGRRAVLTGASIELAPGEVVLLMGTNGSGNNPQQCPGHDI